MIEKCIVRILWDTIIIHNIHLIFIHVHVRTCVYMYVHVHCMYVHVSTVLQMYYGQYDY